MLTKKYTKCIKCQKLYKTSGNTSSLMDHLKRAHPLHIDLARMVAIDQRWALTHLVTFVHAYYYYLCVKQRKHEFEHVVPTVYTESCKSTYKCAIHDYYVLLLLFILIISLLYYIIISLLLFNKTIFSISP
uniref:BED-type domain-containing protein n=1 Tax=Bactrocera latifrons TaxID=174628 RepID=A0A0K8VM54_BACLA